MKYFGIDICRAIISYIFDMRSCTWLEKRSLHVISNLKRLNEYVIRISCYKNCCKLEVTHVGTTKGRNRDMEAKFQINECPKQCFAPVMPVYC